MGPYERVFGSGQARTLEPNKGRRRGANGSSKRGLPSWRRSACKPPGSEKRRAFWRGDTGLFRGARRCGLSGARSLLPGVLERHVQTWPTTADVTLLPGRAGAPPTSLSRRAGGRRQAQLELARHVWDACGDWPSVAGSGKPALWLRTPGVMFPAFIRHRSAEPI